MRCADTVFLILLYLNAADILIFACGLVGKSYTRFAVCTAIPLCGTNDGLARTIIFHHAIRAPVQGACGLANRLCSKLYADIGGIVHTALYLLGCFCRCIAAGLFFFFIVYRADGCCNRKSLDYTLLAGLFLFGTVCTRYSESLLSTQLRARTSACSSCIAIGLVITAAVRHSTPGRGRRMYLCSITFVLVFIHHLALPAPGLPVLWS